MNSNEEIGRRLAELRKLRALTQHELSGCSGVCISTIRKIEQGVGGARMEAYHSLARALGVDTMVFVPPSAGAPRYFERDDDADDLVLADMRNAIAPPIGWDGPVFRDQIQEAPNLVRLRGAVAALAKAYHGNRYDFVGQVAPGLIRSAEFHVAAGAKQEGEHEAVRLRGEVLQLTARYLIQVRELEMALFAIWAAFRDATAVSDQPWAGTIVADQAWALLRQARFSEVEQLCASTAERIEPRISDADSATLGAYGRVLMTASSAAVRNNRSEEAREYLSLAETAAVRMKRETAIPGNMVFGPLTVAIRKPEVELVAGHPDRTLTLAEQLPRGVGKTSASGWYTHRLDVAHALVLTGQDDRATAELTRVRREAPEWLHHSRFGRVVLRELLRTRKRSYSEQQRTLIEFLALEV